DTRLMQISVADLEAGVYFVKVTTENGNTTAKITVTE
ncbi:MAG: T9SS type A sorting domain-containing protein, partial [Bacteroidetes bacterium]|nr:T9SS type A sorting domain-containing protein [Bacteroidota bacterium]